MKFDAFPVEIKTTIMSYLTHQDLCSIVAPVSREWNILAYDYCAWKTLDLCFLTLTNPYITEIFLRDTRPYKVNFIGYKFRNFNIDGLPICNTVREVRYLQCIFHCQYGSEILAKSFPNTEKLSIHCAEKYNYRYGWRNLFPIISDVMQWKNLKSLEIRDLNKYFNSGVVGKMVTKDLKFEELIFVHCTATTDGVLSAIVEYQKQYLRKLVMNFRVISRASYHQLILCEKLSHLSIYKPTNMTDEELLLIITKFTLLTYLRLEKANTIFSATFKESIKNVRVPKLIELIIDNCEQFDNETLKLFVNCSPCLKDLTLQRLNEVTDDGLKCLVVVGSKIEMLHLVRMKMITEECVKQIAIDLPNICELVADKCPLVANREKREIVYNRNYRLLTKNRPDYSIKL